MTYRVGSLCSGYEGIGMAVQAVLGGELAFVADNDPGAAAVLTHHFPSVRNLGDITVVDWGAVEPVDILTAGFPCQDISCAGKRAGLREGTRSGLWFHVARAIAALRPPLVVIENVKELLSEYADSDVEPCTWCLGDAGDERAMRALGAVLADLATFGFDAEWVSLPASGVGCCHRRTRVFLIAWPAADAECNGQPGWAASGTGAADAQRQGPRPALAGCGTGASADAESLRRQRHHGPPPATLRGTHGLDLGPAIGALLPTPETGQSPNGHGIRDGRPGNGHQSGQSLGVIAVELLKTPTAQLAVNGGSQHPDKRREGGHGPTLADQVEHELLPTSNLLPMESARDWRSGASNIMDRNARPLNEVIETGLRGDGPAINWGKYEPAIRRHETVFGTPAPCPVEPGRTGWRLAPRFVEWMMMLPPGWVTDVPGLSRNAQLRLLGNGVVPAQVILALSLLLPVYLSEREAA